MKRAFVIAFSFFSVPLAAIYLCSIVTPYISQAKFWPLSFLALAFPFIASCMFMTVIIWLVLFPKTGVVLLLLFLLGYKNLFSTIGVHYFSGFDIQKSKSNLRVLDWNVRGFVNNQKIKEHPRNPRRRMMDFIKQMEPDILMFQEFDDYNNPLYYSNSRTLHDSLGYKYHYLSVTDDGKSKRNTLYGSAIFSKYPLSNVQRVVINSGKNAESIVLAHVTIENKTFRLATMHLLSLELGSPAGDQPFFGRVNESFIMNRSRMQNFKSYDAIHARQAEQVRNLLDQSPYPLIVSGDFNSVPNSYTYHKIKGDLQDCFVKKGFGFGRTFTGLSPTLRIDYILADKQFKVVQYTSPKLYLSDHFPVVADLNWQQ